MEESEMKWLETENQTRAFLNCRSLFNWAAAAWFPSLNVGSFSFSSVTGGFAAHIVHSHSSSVRVSSLKCVVHSG
jgi:hypothetical protein